jgi:hypothetical protein
MQFESVKLPTLLAALVLSGCEEHGVQRVPVSGIVRIDGRPLMAGTVRFVPTSGRPVSAKIQQDGKFELASENFNQVRQLGAPLGHYRVQVSAARVVNDQAIEWNAPERYADFRTSGLQVVVDKPADDLFIDLTSGGSETDGPVSSTASASSTGAENKISPAPTAQHAAEVSQP